MNCHGRNLVISYLVRNQHKLIIVPSDHDVSPRFGVKIVFVGMAENLLKLGQIKAAQGDPVLEILRPDDP